MKRQVRKGQIWRDWGKKGSRQLVVLSVFPDVARIITCDTQGLPQKSARMQYAKLATFNRSYCFVREAK